jgi:hypothetical protein
MRPNCDQLCRRGRASAWLAALCAAILVCAAAGFAADSKIDPQVYLEHVKVLTSAALEGRGNGSPGLEEAAHYIGRSFEDAGLRPGGDRGTFYQTLDVTTGLRLENGNELRVGDGRASVPFRVGRDYELVSVSETGSSANGPAPLVFAGYGITAAAQHYDDYAGIDVGGRVVLIFTDEPQENDPTSPFDGRTNTLHASVMQKAAVARRHGARAVLLVEDPTHDAGVSRYARWLEDPGSDEFGIPVAHVSRDRIQHALAGEIDLAATALAIDGDLKPRSRALGVTVTFAEHASKIRRPVRNVIGVLGGSDPARAQEAVVIGAHYDHVGKGPRYSLAPEGPRRQIHPGADDNASGVAALIEIAKAAATTRAAFPRSVVFVAFAAEEIGLLGSSYYVNHPTVPIVQTIAMINLDMVGRSAGRILVNGLDSTPSLREQVDLARAGIGLQLIPVDVSAGEGDSDDSAFALRKVPVIGFFSGYHQDYHRPGDTWEKIDAAGGAAVADLALRLASRIAALPHRPEFVPPARPARDGDLADGVPAEELRP